MAKDKNTNIFIIDIPNSRDEYTLPPTDYYRHNNVDTPDTPPPPYQEESPPQLESSFVERVGQGFSSILIATGGGLIASATTDNNIVKSCIGLAALAIGTPVFIYFSSKASQIDSRNATRTVSYEESLKLERNQHRHEHQL